MDDERPQRLGGQPRVVGRVPAEEQAKVQIAAVARQTRRVLGHDRRAEREHLNVDTSRWSTRTPEMRHLDQVTS